MANYTIAQAQQALAAGDETGDETPVLGPPTGGSGGTTVSGYRERLDLTKLQALAQAGINPFDPNISDEEIATTLYQMGLGGPNELVILKAAGLISSADSSAELGIGPNAGTGATAGPYGGGITEQQINDAYSRVQSGTGTFADKVLLDRVASDKLLYGGAGGAGSDHYATDAQIAYDYAQLEEKKNEFGLTFPEQQREFDLQQQLEQAKFGESQRMNDQSILSNRASAGLNTADLVRNLANDQYQRALDPGNYPAYLAASAGLPQGTGSPISALLGQGAQITPPEGGNPLADPRFNGLLGSLYTYGTVPDPAGVGTVRDIASANGGQLPQAFYDYTHTVNPNAQAHAMGGSELVGNSVPAQVGGMGQGLASVASHPVSTWGPQAPDLKGVALGQYGEQPQILRGPVVGIPASQLVRGQFPQFLAGEAGPERINFQPLKPNMGGSAPLPSPVHAHGDYGMPVPHQHDGGHATHEHMGPMIRYADGGSAITGVDYANGNADNQFTPSEGTAVSLGKALQPLGYVPSYVISQLMSGRAPTPGSIDESTMSRLPPSLRALLQAQIKSQVGNAGLLDYNFQLDQNALPGLNNGITSTVYS